MFRIGEFSKITHVPGSQLRYYDEIGLLAPAKINDLTGYRYYSAQQIPELSRILALKDLGLSLDQIKRMIQDDVPVEEIRGMLTLKKIQVEQTVIDEVTRLRHIEARLKQMETGLDIGDYEVILKSIPEMPYLSNRQVCPDFVHARKTLLEMFQVLPASIDMKKLGPVTAILHDDMYSVGDFDIEIGFALNEPEDLVLSLPDGLQMNVRTLPAVETMVTAVQVGLPDESFNCRGILAGWIEANDYMIIGTGREIFHVPPRPGKEAETVMEIQYPIQHREKVSLLK